MKAAGALMAFLALTQAARADYKDEAAIVEAVNRHDVAFDTSKPVRVWGMWFPDPRCAPLAGKTKQANDAAERKLLADCLASLALHANPQGPTTFEPGVVVRLMVRDGKLTGVMSVLGPDPAVPFVMTEVLRDHVGGKFPEVQPDAATRAAIAKDEKAVAAANVVACFDPTGKIDRLEVTPRGAFPDYAKTVEAAVRTWKVAPFMRAGKALRVCTGVAVSWPPGRLPVVNLDTMAPPPPPPPPPK